MTVFSKRSLITELLDRTELLKANTQPFLRLTDEQLGFKPGPEQWSITEIFGHLNAINTIYIRSILARILQAPDVKEDTYRSGWLGDFLYDRTMPRPDGKMYKLRGRRPFTLEGAGRKEILHLFLQQCDAIDDILRHSATKDLRRIRIPLSSARLISLQLGDNLRYMIAYGERHLLQAQQVMAAGIPTPSVV